MEREAFIFYRSFASIQSLKLRERDWLVWALINYALDGKEPDWEKAPSRVVLEILWNSYKPNIDANTRKYLAGKKGGAPIGNSNNKDGRRGKQEPTNNQPGTNQEPTINEAINTDKDKDNANNKENNLDANASSPDGEQTDLHSEGEKKKITKSNQVMDLWNKMLTETGAQLPPLAKFTDKRRKKVQVRWREFAEIGEPSEVVMKIFQNACTSKFFQGDNPRGWSGTFDWIFENEKNWVKVYEGNYDNRPSNKSDGYDRLRVEVKGPEDYEGDF